MDPVNSQLLSKLSEHKQQHHGCVFLIQTSYSPSILHSLDVEPQSGTNGGDVLSVQPLDNRGLACIVQAPAFTAQA